jgi:hypothetical protein
VVDFVPVDQGKAWPEYERIGQAGIYAYPGLCPDIPVQPGYLLRNAGIYVDMPA